MRTIEYKVSFEKMVSRIPGLFAYLESDEFGNVSLHKATDSLNGCWGKIVQNIKLPVSLSVEGQTILESGKVYTYRTIIDYYYQYKDYLEENDTFVSFIKNGIGRITVPEDKKGEETPKYIFLSNARKLYNELVKMNKLCEFYKKNYRLGLSEKDEQLCCLCERYEQLGGNKFKDYVGTLIPQAETIAEQYKGYAENAQNDNKPMTVDFNVDLVSTYQDLGIMTPYAPIWIPGRKYYKNDKVIYEDELYICKTENNGKWDDNYLTIVFDTTKFQKCDSSMKVYNNDRPTNLTPFKIEGKTDSKLVDLRRFVTYYNDDGVAQRPSNGYDWLFYYRKNNVVNIRTINDELGNVKTLTGQTATNVADNLAAYGDIIEDITYNTTERTIKFKYRLGIHLKADGAPTVVVDDDGNKLYKWNKFIWDNDTRIGAVYEEEYIYEEDSDLEKLINGTFTLAGVVDIVFTFTNYINGDYDKILPSYKFEFVTINNSFSYDKTIAHQNVNIVSYLNDFELYRNDFDEFDDCGLLREDFLMGISYKPTKDTDIRIQRGSTSAFEKHIAFGEVKTLEDMINYDNGSFFKMTDG